MRNIRLRSALKNLLISLCVLLSTAHRTPVGRPRYTYIPHYVSVRLTGQFGNQLFEIATAYAYSLDHHLPLYIPDLVSRKEEGVPKNASSVFLRKISPLSHLAQPSLIWQEPSFNYSFIPESKAIELRGYFQSETYFAHRRDEILDLFEMPQHLYLKILDQYPFLLTQDQVVGIQIRDYRQIAPTGEHHPTLGRKYYERAISLFPKDTIFVVSSNNSEFARECLEGLAPNFVYLNADYIEEFYTLTLCKSFIISNSTFGWWAAWLSRVQNKQIIAPNLWFTPPFDNQSMMKDLIPKYFQIVEAQ